MKEIKKSFRLMERRPIMRLVDYVVVKQKYYCLAVMLFMAGMMADVSAQMHILGNYTGEINVAITLLGIEESLDGVSIELKQSATDYSLVIPETDLGNGVILPEYELDSVLITTSGAGYTLTKSGSLNFSIPMIEIPPMPPLFPSGETFYDVPVAITLENGYVENNILTLEIKAVVTLTVYGFPMPIPVNLYFEGIKAMPDVVEIYTSAELKELADFVNAGYGNLTSGVTYILMNDIYLNAYNWTPIGTNADGDANKRFKGHFNGNNKKIKGLAISSFSLNTGGLFGYIEGGIIENLGIENANISVNASNECETGVLAGHIAFSTNTKISNCYTTGTINSTANSSSIAGGLIGFSEGCEVSNCYSTATVNCNANNESIAGGLIGGTEYTTTSNCYATGKITSSSTAYNRAGGLVGANQGSSVIRNCVAANSTIIATSYLTANRIIGYNVEEEALFNNYALEGMTMIINDVPVTVTPDLFGKEGANATISTLCSTEFYNLPANWDTSEGEIWNIELPDGLWKICERERLPFFSWQGISCLIDEAFCGGNGSPDNPFQICTPKDLDYVRKGLHLNFILMNDLDLTDYIEETYWDNGWIPIGYPDWPEEGTPFEGTFEGNNHKITGLWLVREEYPAGLFSVTKNATIKNLGVDCEVEGSEFVGGLAGKNGKNSVIENCYVTGGVLGMEHTGGLTGFNDFGASIKNCYASGTISGKYSMGMGNNTGGLVGSNFSSIQNCYATGTVSGSYNLGGLVGYNAEGSIINCVAANSSVTANDNEADANRITGYSPKDTLSNNYALESMTVNIGGAPVTITSALNGESGADATLTNLHSFTFYNTSENWNTEEGEVWDIENPDGVWKICDGEKLPFLRWQGISCEGEHVIVATANANGSISPAGNVVVAQGDNQTFTFTANTGYEIDQVVIDGTNNPAAVIAGSYTFENVTEDHTIHVTFRNGTEIVETQFIASPRVYPTPTTGELTIEISNLKLSDIQLYDIVGKLQDVKIGQPDGGQSEITMDISQLAPGVYFLKIQTEQGGVTKKVIKK